MTITALIIERLFKWFRFFSAGFIAFITLSVMIGIVFNLHQFRGFALSPIMQFNTAILILLTSIGVLLIHTKYQKLNLMISIFVILISGLTLLEYILNADFGIDMLVVSPIEVYKVSAPGRMGINTALCIFLMGLSLFILTETTWNKRYLIAGVLAALGSAVAFVAIVGYLGSLETAYGWFQATYMAFTTAVCLSFLGLSLMIETWKTLANQKDFWLDSLFSIPMIILFMTMIICLWFALRTREFESDEADKKTEVQYLKNLLKNNFQKLDQDFYRMASRWNVLGGVSEIEWNTDAKNFLDQQHALIAISLIDKNGEIIRMKGSDPNQVIRGFIDDKNLWEKSKNSHQSSVIEFYDDQQYYFLLIQPLSKKSAFDGFLVGEFNSKEFISDIISKAFLTISGIDIYSNDWRLYSNSLPNSISVAKESYVQDGINWTIIGNLNAKTSSHSSFLSIIPLIAGLFIALIFWVISRWGIEYQNKTIELKNTLKSLQETQNLLVQQEKLASLGQVIAGIAHEIKNPLTFILMFTELSQRSLDDYQSLTKETLSLDEKESLKVIEENLANIIAQGKRANSIMQRMLSHVRVSTGIKIPANVQEVLDDYFNVSYKAFRADNSQFIIDVIKDYRAKPETVIPVITEDLGRVFLNLFQNAFYSLYQKAIILHSNFKPQIKITTALEDSWYKIEIEDNGAGIPSWAIDKIFTPFFTTKPTGQGTGLGLSLSHTIIAQEHRGKLEFESSENKGAKFTIFLPLDTK